MKDRDNAKLYFQMGLSSLVVLYGLYVVGKGTVPTQNWASAMVGSIVTYWLRPK